MSLHKYTKYHQLAALWLGPICITKVAVLVLSSGFAQNRASNIAYRVSDPTFFSRSPPKHSGHIRQP